MGTILGTAAYMAPEQARGRPVDKRADIWAFGCVLYEMVTGRRAFAGEDITETLASVVKEPPDLSAAPPALRRLLGRCLEKDPKKRVRDISDVWDLVDEPGATAPAAPRARPASRLAWIVAAAAGLAALGLAVIWSPDGSEIVYATMNRAGLAKYEIRRKAMSGAGAEETLVRLDTVVYLWHWSPDGTFLVYSTPYNNSMNDLWMLTLDGPFDTLRAGKRQPVQLTKTPAEDQYGQVSPDGRWLAYAAGNRGRMQVFVQSIPKTGTLRLVSKDGGSMPRWRQDGKEMYYRAADGQLMAVPITTAPGPTSGFDHGTPRPLFGPIPTVGNLPRFTYQPSSDGQRFLVAAPVASGTPPLTVVLNWQAGITR